ncbi:MAG: hypothetical protein NC900_06235, partial [Candidatus Omnitrophica bacterium]|nr:hypothetical protein [Candidatus Omnitrophota bacterium]
MQRRILLLYISEISGHHSATLAIEKALKLLDKDIITLNLNGFNYTNPTSEKLVNYLYMGVIKKLPWIWDYLYDNIEVKKRIDTFKNFIHKINRPKLKILFDSFLPQVIICSQAYPCGMVADYKRYYRENFKLIAVLTDYIPHSYWIYDTIDYYI